MASFKILQDLVQKARLAARDNVTSLDAVHVSIYDLAMHAFMNEVLTLARMTCVVQAVRLGIEDSASQAADAGTSGNARSQCEAYRGLCTAANEGLTAASLAYAELRKFSGQNLSAEFSSTLLQEGLEFKRLLDQITIRANWLSNNRITRLQAHGFDQLLQLEEHGSKQEKVSAIPWSHVFFQSCGYETRFEKPDVQATLMLLGLITSGTLIGLRASQATASSSP